jgi:hypothetical protein
MLPMLADSIPAAKLSLDDGRGNLAVRGQSMWADIYAYLRSIAGQWLTGYWVLTAVPEVLTYLLPPRWTANLDSIATREFRRKCYLTLALIGVLISGFQAWHEEFLDHQAVKADANNLRGQLTQLEGNHVRLPTDLSPEAAVTIHDFFPSTRLSFSKVVRPCWVRITASDDNMSLRDLLIHIIGFTDKCSIWNPGTDGEPLLEDTAPAGIAVHRNSDTQPSGYAALKLFYATGFKVSASHVLPAGSPPELFWLEIGRGSPWR